ncbi:MAG: universal stress protein [Solirubrobacteraceae bacterium]|nr:universal stress protein [Solirubrobacteraceae bacterium]
MTDSAAQLPSDGQTPAPAAFGRVVVAVGTDGGVAAIDLALALAAPDAVFVLVRIHHAQHRAGAVAQDNARARDTAEALRLLKVGRAALDRPCEIVVEDDTNLIEGLHRVASREDADLLVVGAHRDLDDAASALPGVLHGAPCAVAVVGQRPAADAFRIEKVGVAFCATPVGTHAAHVAAAAAARHDAELHAMHVVPVEVSPWMGPAASALHELQRLDGSLAEAARADISELRPPATAHVVEGHPIQALTDFGATLDLLTIGSRAAGPLRRLLLGSTADALCTVSPCALLVVAGPDTEPEPESETEVQAP